tara:strand:- start:1774 stop:2046 length:273 start_codon:yes stop_codon:yes gene_type:complete
MKVHLKKLSQKDIEERKANYNVFVKTKDKEMKGLIEVTATKGGKTITSEVFGDLSNKDRLFARLMNHNKIIHSQRILWKLTNVKLIKEIK